MTDQYKELRSAAVASIETEDDWYDTNGPILESLANYQDRWLVSMARPILILEILDELETHKLALDMAVSDSNLLTHKTDEERMEEYLSDARSELKKKFQ